MGKQIWTISELKILFQERGLDNGAKTKEKPE
jgi:hypothetical protein